MRNILLATIAMLSVSAPAFAGGVQGVVGGAFIAGQVTGAQGTTTTTNTSIFGQGSATGSSASGTNFSLGGSGGSSATFSSNGKAFSSTTVSPFGVDTTSGHTAYSAGYASNGAAFSAENQTFGQSNGSSAFSSQQNTSKTSYDATAFKIGGAAGFAGFEAGFGGFSQ